MERIGSRRSAWRILWRFAAFSRVWQLSSSVKEREKNVMWRACRRKKFSAQIWIWTSSFEEESSINESSPSMILHQEDDSVRVGIFPNQSNRIYKSLPLMLYLKAVFTSDTIKEMLKNVGNRPNLLGYQWKYWIQNIGSNKHHVFVNVRNQVLFDHFANMLIISAAERACLSRMTGNWCMSNWNKMRVKCYVGVILLYTWSCLYSYNIFMLLQFWKSWMLKVWL